MSVNRLPYGLQQGVHSTECCQQTELNDVQRDQGGMELTAGLTLHTMSSSAEVRQVRRSARTDSLTGDVSCPLNISKRRLQDSGREAVASLAHPIAPEGGQLGLFEQYRDDTQAYIFFGRQIIFLSASSVKTKIVST